MGSQLTKRHGAAIIKRHTQSNIATDDNRNVIHIALHFIVPALAALTFYRDRWRHVTLILIATMLVDLDHLLADPIYDPNRCSIGYHPLHTTPAILVYVFLFVLPFVVRKGDTPCLRPAIDTLHLIGSGLSMHMALDWIDCLMFDVRWTPIVLSGA